MSFWRFNFTPAATNSIDSLLNALPAPSSPSSSPQPLSLADQTLYEETLDALLGTPDLLSEIKAGTNQRLIDFLARAEVVNRLGGWVVWGLGGEPEEEVEMGGIVDDAVEDGQVPEEVVLPGEKKKSEMGGVLRRRNMDEMGVLEGGEPETEQEKTWAGYPRLSTEILAIDTPGLTDTLFNPIVASSQPHTCPAPPSFLLPFWESLLRSTELQLETRSVQVGYWARVNGVLLSGPKGAEILACILTIPNLLSRLLTLLPICSPLNDLLLLLLRISTPPSPLLTSLVPQVLRMLDPFGALAKEGHVAAEELLRGVIELCSAAPTTPQGPGGQTPPQSNEVEWRENGLARQIADERAVRTLVECMLEGVEPEPSKMAIVPAATEDETPRLASVALPDGDPATSADLRTSSLIQSISVLVDLIRKNNSDFVEQQMLTWARRKEAEDSERELLQADGPGVREEVEKAADSDRGPSLVDLGALLAIVSERLGGFQELIKNPRSPHAPVATSAGLVAPLTLERFRICEFYAELLHCSNMSLLNRPTTLPTLYDADGYLLRGWRAADDLSAALAGPGPEEDDRETRLPVSSPSPASKAAFPASSPVDIRPSYSGMSTPSGQGSLDSESGILTRAEAKELRDLVAAAGADAGSEDGEDDPFGDTAVAADVSEMAEAIGALELDGDRPTEMEALKEAASLRRASLARATLPPGPLLKQKFMDDRVVETILDLFFNFPWNNFVHNVVFDILQQIFHGRIDRKLDRQLAISVFLDGRLIERILAGQAANDAQSGIRFGYMGHMTLIAEEVIKLFEHYPKEVYAVVQPHIPHSEWNRYINTTLRETRERDLSPLGGGISIVAQDATSTTSEMSDEDDEFPMNSSRVMRATETGQAGGGPATDEGAFGGYGKASTSTDGGEGGDQFSRYLANAISSDRPDKFGSSDEDDDDEDAGGWLGGSRFDPGDVDFALSDSNGPKKFGFDDRFESSGRQVFGSASPDSDDEADWGPFAADSSSPSKSNPFATDEFRPTIASTSVTEGFETSFSDSFGSDNFGGPSSFATAGTEGDDDDFGDFETGGTSILLPSALDDFDFDEDARTTPTSVSFGAKPSFGRTATADDGSAFFGGLASAFEDESSSPVSSPPASPSVQADRATSVEEPLGPSMHGDARLTEDGFVETVVEGRKVRVPADEIALAHRRSSSGSDAERPTFSLDSHSSSP